MIDEFFVLRTDGLCLFHLSLDKEVTPDKEMNTDLFAGFSSAIVAFSDQLGGGKLSKIELEEDIYVYDRHDNIIVVTKIGTDEDLITANHVIALLYREFINDYVEIIALQKATMVRRDVFHPFANKVREIVAKCEKVARNNPKLLANIPPSVDINAIEELSDFSEELVSKFPEATIRLTRKFQDKLEKELMSYTMQKLGLEVGKDVAKERLRRNNKRSVLKLLREISVVKEQNNQITLTICPFCRGRESTEPYCEFVSGFIEGALDDSTITVKEISCHAMGDKNCIFEIVEK